jgi:hypothetical protein
MGREIGPKPPAVQRGHVVEWRREAYLAPPEAAMTKVTRIAAFAFSTMLLALPSEASAQATAATRSEATCLPPGGNPAPCGTARAGQTIRLRIATTNMPTGPITLLFAEQAAPGQAPRSASLTIPPGRSRDGGYEVTVPRTLCVAARDRMGNFEIQRLMSTYNQSETTRDSLGTLTVAC